MFDALFGSAGIYCLYCKLVGIGRIICKEVNNEFLVLPVNQSRIKRKKFSSLAGHSSFQAIIFIGHIKSLTDLCYPASSWFPLRRGA